MAYQVLFKPSALRELAKLPRLIAERIAPAIDALARQPRPPGCKKLAGGGNLWRIRVGDYRIIYQVHDDRLVVLIARIGHRGNIYD